VLIAADMLSDIEIPTCNAAPAIYRATLAELEPLVEGGAVETLIPGHGAIARGRDAVRERLARDIAYLDTLESEVRRLHGEGRTLAEIRRALAGMPDVERHAEFPQRENHEENIQLAHQGLAAAHTGH
jgi:hypothetical protein